MLSCIFIKQYTLELDKNTSNERGYIALFATVQSEWIETNIVEREMPAYH